MKTLPVCSFFLSFPSGASLIRPNEPRSISFLAVSILVLTNFQVAVFSLYLWLYNEGWIRMACFSSHLCLLSLQYLIIVSMVVRVFLFACHLFISWLLLIIGLSSMVNYCHLYSDHLACLSCGTIRSITTTMFFTSVALVHSIPIIFSVIMQAPLFFVHLFHHSPSALFP